MAEKVVARQQLRPADADEAAITKKALEAAGDIDVDGLTYYTSGGRERGVIVKRGGKVVAIHAGDRLIYEFRPDPDTL